MLSLNIIDKQIEELNELLNILRDPNEITQIKSLRKVLANSKHLMIAIEKDFEFDENNLPDTVFLFDKERNMFWKEFRGYTLDIMHSKLFSYEEAKRKVEEDYNNNTKMVTFECDIF